MKRHIAAIAGAWLVFTILGEWWAYITPLNPAAYSVEAHHIDGAFQTMTIFAMPVFAFVVVMLVYSILRFRVAGEPTQDGPPIKGKKRVVLTWLAVTSSLCVLLIINPGLTEMAALREPTPPDLEINITGARFFWRAAYTKQKISSSELVLPVDQRVKFDVTATDVLHSFWIPAFRIKVDAVPGLTTTTFVTPTALGSFETDPNLRVQCSELCGAAHYLMKMPVRVVSSADFAAWVKEKQEESK